MEIFEARNILGLSRDYNLKDLKAAYHEKCFMSHPDVSSNPVLNACDVNEAYDTLFATFSSMPFYNGKARFVDTQYDVFLEKCRVIEKKRIITDEEKKELRKIGNVDKNTNAFLYDEVRSFILRMDNMMYDDMHKYANYLLDGIKLTISQKFDLNRKIASSITEIDGRKTLIDMYIGSIVKVHKKKVLDECQKLNVPKYVRNKIIAIANETFIIAQMVRKINMIINEYNQLVKCINDCIFDEPIRNSFFNLLKNVSNPSDVLQLFRRYNTSNSLELESLADLLEKKCPNLFDTIKSKDENKVAVFTREDESAKIKQKTHKHPLFPGLF